jgi:hypothetical protein
LAYLRLPSPAPLSSSPIFPVNHHLRQLITADRHTPTSAPHERNHHKSKPQ